MREIMSQNEISQYINEEIHLWLNANTRSEIIEAIKITAYTGHHHVQLLRWVRKMIRWLY